MEPKLLTDKSRLQEIYDLRVLAYEQSSKSVYVNRTRFPNGWKDNLDERPDSLHWVIEDAGRIVASARMVILEDPTDTLEDLTGIELPLGRPFAYWSRLVVHANYRKMGIANLLDKVRMEWLINYTEVKFAICWATAERESDILKSGFKYMSDYQFNWGEYCSANQNLSVLPMKQKVFIKLNKKQINLKA